MSESYAEPRGGITFGKVVAGAAVAVGAVMLAAAVFTETGTLGELFENIGNKLGAIFGGKHNFSLPELGPKTTAALLGTTLVGGGIALSGAMDEKADDAHRHAVLAQVAGDPVPGGHAERVQMGAIQSLMKGRMMAESPEYMSAMAGQGIG